jgi:hypothetical protein
MHTARQLSASHFAVSRGDRPATREDLLRGWGAHDRLGVVVTEPFGALGASHLIQLAITAFYDARPSRRSASMTAQDDNAIYPDIYLFHVGEAHGDHSGFDFWPARKEVVVRCDPRAVLDAINDRAITRLAVPDGPAVAVEHEWKEPAAARDRIAAAYAYAPGGRVRDPNWRVSGLEPRTEANVRSVLNPDKRYASAAAYDAGDLTDPELAARSWLTRTRDRRMEGEGGLALARRRRDAIRGDGGVVSETYRDVTVDEALLMLV